MEPLGWPLLLPGAHRDDLLFVASLLELDPELRLPASTASRIEYFDRHPQPSLPAAAAVISEANLSGKEEGLILGADPASLVNWVESFC
jgi:hypothetical protein